MTLDLDFANIRAYPPGEHAGMFNAASAQRQVAHARLVTHGAILAEVMPRKFLLVLLGCSALAAQQVAANYGVTAQYMADFAGHSWTQEPKLTQEEIGTDIPIGVAPLRPVLHLKGRLPNRADDNTVEIIPLRDPSVPDFAKAYPKLNSSAAALRSLLARSQLPGRKEIEKGDPSTVDSEYSLCARVERVESPWVGGFAFLVQSTQEAGGSLPNNRELSYQFLGITKDGAYLVDATFAVNHASLPTEPTWVNSRKLRDGEHQLSRWDENAFQPPLSRLRAIIRSLAAVP